MTHPYRDLPDQAFWRRAVAVPPMAEIDPVVAAPFLLHPADRIATAGSCFAQHIARTLRDSGLAPLVTETMHPLAPPELGAGYGYGIYTARTGNIYTSRQLVQLFDRAYGRFQPEEDIWPAEGGWLDPFRPTDPARSVPQPGRATAPTAPAISPRCARLSRSSGLRLHARPDGMLDVARRRRGLPALPRRRRRQLRPRAPRHAQPRRA